MITIENAVSSDPEILGGTLCFSGTRIPVRKLLDYVEGGIGIDAILESFDWVSRAQVTAVLDHSVNSLDAGVGKSHAA